MFAVLHPTTDTRTTLTISPHSAGILPGSLAGVAPVRGAACNDMEVFKDIPGYEGRYMVSNLGRVKSIRVTKKGTIIRLLKPCKLRKGHLGVVLCTNGRPYGYGVHRLVAAAFIGPRPSKMNVCHSDGNPANNIPSNLRYDTPAGNQADRIRHGTHNRGLRNANNKLTEAQVLAIRADTRPQGIVAADYGISPSNVSLITLRKAWGWLKDN